MHLSCGQGGRGQSGGNGASAPWQGRGWYARGRTILGPTTEERLALRGGGRVWGYGVSCWFSCGCGVFETPGEVWVGKGGENAGNRCGGGASAGSLSEVGVKKCSFVNGWFSVEVVEKWG